MSMSFRQKQLFSFFEKHLAHQRSTLGECKHPTNLKAVSQTVCCGTMDPQITESEICDAASLASNDSAAIVSLYNSWSSSSECDSQDDGLESVVPGFTMLPDSMLEPEVLLDNLKKRCREEDLPPVPKLRARQRPNCLFLNYMGSTRMDPALAYLQPEGPPLTIGFPPTLDLGFDLDFDENDDLYPFCSKKARRSDDLDEAVATSERDWQGVDASSSTGHEASL